MAKYGEGGIVEIRVYIGGRVDKAARKTFQGKPRRENEPSM